MDSTPISNFTQVQDSSQTQNSSIKNIMSGHSHSFDTGIAHFFNSVDVAVVFNHILFWLRHNKSKNKNQHDSQTWMYDTNADIAEDIGYLNERQVKYCIHKLVENKFLIRSYYNKNNLDRTPWYSISDESIIAYDFKESCTKRQNCPEEETKLSRPQDKIVPTSYITDIEPDKETISSPPSNSKEVLEIFSFFVTEIRKDKEDFLVQNEQAWKVEIERMMRIDKRKPEKIKQVITWSRGDNFWKAQILSPEKLRKQFDQLELKMASEGVKSRVEQNRRFAVECKSENPEELKRMTFTDKYVINAATGKDLMFDMQPQAFKNAFLNLFECEEG